MGRSEKESRELLEFVLKNTLSMDDTFTFGCKQCGDCCRNRHEPIILAGYDIYNIAKGTGKHPIEVLKEFTEHYEGPDSMLPIIVLRERPDGSCKLLRKGKCMIQEDKPIVCRLYPLGRYFSEADREFKYFKQPITCGNNQTIKVGDWLEQFHIPDFDEATLLWNKLIMSSTKYIRDLRLVKKDNEKADKFYMSCLAVFYHGYNLETPPAETLKRGIEVLERTFTDFKVK